MNTKQLTVAKALTYKKRVIESILQVQKDISDYNSITVVRECNKEGKEISRNIDRKDMDIRYLVTRRGVLKKHLIDLKLAMWKISEEIRRDILCLAEMKSDIQFWSALDTDDGIHEGDSWRQNNTHECDSIIKQDEVRKIIRDLKLLIDETQQKIDTFNYSTKFDIEDIGSL